jgi:hypothetical protein
LIDSLRHWIIHSFRNVSMNKWIND